MNNTKIVDCNIRQPAKPYIDRPNKEQDMDIKYELSVRMDDIPVRGNAMASGDDTLDKAVEDEILARLESGDVWAWAEVTVTASFEGFEGHDYLCGCSYKDEEEFRKDAYYEDMCGRARDVLMQQIEDVRERIARIDALQHLKKGQDVAAQKGGEPYRVPDADIESMRQEALENLADPRAGDPVIVHYDFPARVSSRDLLSALDELITYRRRYG